MLCLPDPTSFGSDDDPVVAAVPLNSYEPEPKGNCVRVFKTSDTVLTDAMIRAQKLQSTLSHDDLPTLIKFMHPSICSGGYSLFCEHLPSEDCEVILEDDELRLYKTKYLARKKTLSGGWRGFSILHNLVVGDVVVFQLIALMKMKVHIVRIGSSIDSITATPRGEVKETENADTGNVTDESPNISPSASEIRFSQSNIKFNNITSFKDFHIIFENLIINSEFTTCLRQKYYNLCNSQSMFLHENLLKGINIKLAAGIIIETVSIADAVKASGRSTTTSKEDDAIVWDKSLKAMEGLGMNVRFLREMLCYRMGNEMFDLGKCGSDTRDELLVKLLEVEESARKFYGEIEALKNGK